MTIARGLEPREGHRKRVIVIGAGVAGLVAGYELDRQGHAPVILEARNRVGGRIHTIRDLAPGLYAEAGAMRIPRVHELTLAYCRRFGLPLRPFLMDTTRAPIYLAGRRLTFVELEQGLGAVPFELYPSERRCTYAELLERATHEARKFLIRAGRAGLASLDSEFGDYSIREFLRDQGLSEGAIELLGIMSYREANMGASVAEYLREILGGAFEDMEEIAGGMDQFPQAFYRRLQRHVIFGAQVIGVDQTDGHVVVHYKTSAGTFGETADYCICTVPFGLVRHLEFRPALSKGKYRAIRSLNYNPSTKIFLQVRHRFWQGHGVIGGATPTDLPIRRIVYPSHDPTHDERGILLASYTWGQDAARWGALPPAERVELALKDVAKVYPEVVQEFEVGASYAWYGDPYAAGAFALFEPGQEALLQDDITKPEGRIYFAGEHCSLWHAWIEGAVESGVRAAEAVHQAAPPLECLAW